MYRPLFSVLESTPSGSGFLAEVSRSFLDREVNFGPVADVATATGILLAGLVLVYLVRRHLESRRRAIPIDVVAGDASIRPMLERTVTERARFEMQFSSPDGKRRATAFCTCVDVTDSALTLECSSIAAPSTSWTGRGVDVLFRLQEAATEAFYAFHTQIRETSLSDDGLLLVSIALPHELERKQKRAFLRLVPPQHLVRGIALWPAPPEFTARSEWSPHSLPPPGLVHDGDDGANIRLANISGGGVRLHITREGTRKCALTYTPGLPLLLRLALFDPEENRTMHFWLSCVLRNHFTETETLDSEVGLQFIMWGTSTTPLGAVTWNTARLDGEVEQLTRWTLRRHLELYRGGDEA